MRALHFELVMLGVLVLIAAPVFAQGYGPEDDPPPGGDPPPEQGNGVIHDVTVQNVRFTPANLDINTGDTVRWTNTAGFHSTSADDGTWNFGPQGVGWTFSFTFSEEHAGANPYYCSIHGEPGGFGMSGVINVVSGGGDDDDDDDDDFLVNYGIIGSWANFLTLGQGWLFEIIPGFDPAVMVAYNFTYPPLLVQKGGDPEFFGNQMWLVGAGEIQGNMVTIMADRPIAGAFDDPLPPFFPAVPYATFIFTFLDCFNAMVSYDIPSKNLIGEYPIERITPDVMCEDLAAQP